MTRPEWIEVGRVSRAHGVRGEVRVLPSTDNPERFAPGSVLSYRAERVGIAGSRRAERVRLTIADVRGEDGFPIVAFKEVPDRTAAEALRGGVLEVESSDLPDLEEDEYYPFDLIGLIVRDTTGEVRGVVSDIVESPAHPLLVVRPGAVGDAGGASVSGPSETGGSEAGAAGAGPAEVYVPFVKEIVPQVELAGGYLVVETAFL